MQISKYRYVVPVIIVALALFGAAISGCLISGTKAFTLPIAPPAKTATGGSVNEEVVDLDENSTFQDYKDKIRIIDRIGFRARITENMGTAENMSMYFSATSNMVSATQVRAQATPLFENYPIPASGTVVIDYDQSLKILQNFELLQELAKTGEFSIYTLADDTFNLTFVALEFVITFTVGL